MLASDDDILSNCKYHGVPKEPMVDCSLLF